MKFTQCAILLTTSMALASCGSAVDPDKRKPGKWQSTVTLESIELTGVPKGSEDQMEKMKDSIKQSIERSGTRPRCVTAEQAANEDVSQVMTKAMGGQCEFTKEEVGDGKIDVVGSCKMSGQEMDVTMAGTLTPEKIEMTTTLTSEAKTSGIIVNPGMNMVVKTDVSHVGDCD